MYKPKRYPDPSNLIPDYVGIDFSGSSAFHDFGYKAGFSASDIWWFWDWLNTYI
tara:strand:+ start:472 stop:633 length:162 start_codon:yes stop_codon:yes gene_type:complete